ncbi:MAG: hypothetical protein ACLGIN_06645 [Candidatus Sericytochromatia bacterium]
MADPRFEPRSTPPPPVAPPPPDDGNYHCENCLKLEDPVEPSGYFWACQNLCVRE